MSKTGFSNEEEDLLLRLVSAEHQRNLKRSVNWRTVKAKRISFSCLQKLHLSLTERNRLEAIHRLTLEEKKSQ